MRIGRIGTPWIHFLAAVYWVGLAILWAIGNMPNDLRFIAFWIAVAGAVIYTGKGVYALVNPPTAPPERTAPKERYAGQMIIYIVLGCTVLFAVYTGFWLFIELGKMQR